MSFQRLDPCIGICVKDQDLVSKWVAQISSLFLIMRLNGDPWRDMHPSTLASHDSMPPLKSVPQLAIAHSLVFSSFLWS